MDLVCPSCGTGFAASDAEIAAQGGVSVCPTCNNQVQAPWSALELDIDTDSGEHPSFDLEFSAAPSPEVAGPVETLDAASGTISLSVDSGAPTAAPIAVPELQPVASSPDVALDTSPQAARAAAGAPALAATPASAAAAGLDLESGPATAGPAAAMEVARGPSAPPATVANDLPLTGERVPSRPAAELPFARQPTAPGPQPSAQPSVQASGRPGLQPSVQPQHVERPAADRPKRRAAALKVSHAGPSHAVVVSAETRSTWQLYAAVTGTALVAIVAGGLRWWSLSRPPPPPQMPNPLRAQVQAWKAAGLVPAAPTVEEALRTARAGLASGSTAGLREAMIAARSALLINEDAPGAVALYAGILGRRPEYLEPDEISNALGAITSVIGVEPDTIYRAELEEARAWLQLKAGRLEAARRAASVARERAPDSVWAQLAYAATRMRTRPAEALAELDKLRDRDDLPLLHALLLGEAQLRSGNLAQARSTWERSQVGGPEDVAVARRLAKLSADIGELDDATQRMQTVAGAGWASVEDRIFLARLLARVERMPDLALAQLDGGLDDEELSQVNRARLIAEKAAVVATARGKLRSAEEVSRWLDAALELAPDLPELLYVAGLLDERAGDRDSAVDLLEAADDVAPERPEVALRLGLALSVDDVPSAVQVVNDGLRETPSYVPLHLLKVALELEAGRPTGAMATLRRALDFDPERYGKGRELDAFVDPPQAHLRIAKLLGRHVRRLDNPMLITAVGMAYYCAGDTKRAVGQLNRAARLDPQEVGARLYRAIIAVKKKKRGSARRDLEAALDADSQHGVVRLYQAKLLELSGKNGEAEKVYLDLLARNPLDGAARIGVARTLAARKERRQALEHVVRVLSSRPNDRDALRFLAQDERRRGKRRR